MRFNYPVSLKGTEGLEAKRLGGVGIYCGIVDILMKGLLEGLTIVMLDFQR